MKSIIAIAMILALCGCYSGLTVVLTDSSAVTAGSYQVGETPIPAVSYNVGPRFMLRAPGAFATNATLTISAHATITNETSALGIYDSTEAKDLKIDMSLGQ